MAEFLQPVFQNRFFVNLRFLLRDAELVSFDSRRWVKRPWHFCLDVYNEPYLAPVILLTNNVGSFLEFTPERLPVIITPRREAISEILSR